MLVRRRRRLVRCRVRFASVRLMLVVFPSELVDASVRAVRFYVLRWRARLLV